MEQPLLAKLQKTLAPLKKQLARETLRWVAPSNYHITLHFLGDVAEKQLNEYAQILEEKFQNGSPFELQFTKISPFPEAKGRMVTLLASADSQLTQYRTGITEVARELQLSRPDRTEFIPHVTLARKSRRAKETLQFEPIYFRQKMEVCKLQIVISKLSDQGAKYHVFKEIGLRIRK